MLFGIARAFSSVQQICVCRLLCGSEDCRRWDCRDGFGPVLTLREFTLEGGDRCEHRVVSGVCKVLRINSRNFLSASYQRFTLELQQELWDLGLQGWTEQEAGRPEGWPGRQNGSCEHVCGATCCVLDFTRTQGWEVRWWGGRGQGRGLEWRAGQLGWTGLCLPCWRTLNSTGDNLYFGRIIIISFCFWKRSVLFSDPLIPSACAPASRNLVLVGSQIPPLSFSAVAFHSWHHGWCRVCPVAGCAPGPQGLPGTTPPRSGAGREPRRHEPPPDSASGVLTVTFSTVYGDFLIWGKSLNSIFVYLLRRQAWYTLLLRVSASWSVKWDTIADFIHLFWD